MFKKYRKLFILTFILACFYSPARADENPMSLSREVSQIVLNTVPPKSWQRISEEKRKEIEDIYGTTFAVLINSQVQTSLHSKRNEGNTRGAWYYNIALEQRLWKDSRLHFEIEGGHNKGIDKLIPTFSIFDSDAGEISYLYVTKLFLKQKLFNDRLLLSAGRLDLSDWFDVNMVANSSDTQFLSSALVNNLTIPFPQKGLGAMFNFIPRDWFYLQAGASDAKASSTRVGLNNAFDGTFFIGELGFTPKIKERQGNYRFIFHYNRQKLPLIASNGDLRHDYGAALSFDQEITKDLILFCRYGFADPKVRSVQNFWSLGAQLTEPIPGRKSDYMGVGMAQSIFGNDYCNTNSSASAETMYELYYNIQAWTFVEIIPNLQIVTHPNGDKDQSCAIVGGARVVVIF